MKADSSLSSQDVGVACNTVYVTYTQAQTLSVFNTGHQCRTLAALHTHWVSLSPRPHACQRHMMHFTGFQKQVVDFAPTNRAPAASACTHQQQDHITFADTL
jgi:hypothetical protein